MWIVTSPFADRPEKIARHRLAPGPVGQEGEESRAGGEERALAPQEADIERLNPPEAEPKLTNMPKGFRQSSEPGKVALPTPS